MESDKKEIKNQLTIKEVEKLRVDAIYGKKKHYNAADRKSRYHYWLGVVQIILNVLLGSYLFGAASMTMPNALNWAGAVLALISATAAALQTYYNFDRQVEQHRAIATRYLAIAKECSRIIAYYKDGALSASVLREQFEALSKECDRINADSEKCPPGDQDYRKAQLGFKSGEEEYTMAERTAR